MTLDRVTAPRPIRVSVLCRVKMRSPVGRLRSLRRGTWTIDGIALAFGRIGACGSVGGPLVPAKPTYPVPATIVIKYTGEMGRIARILHILLSPDRTTGSRPLFPRLRRQRNADRLARAFTSPAHHLLSAPLRSARPYDIRGPETGDLRVSGGAVEVRGFAWASAPRRVGVRGNRRGLMQVSGKGRRSAGLKAWCSQAIMRATPAASRRDAG